MASYLLLVLLSLLSICDGMTRTPLGKFIKHYEPLYYDAANVHKVHRRAVEGKQFTHFDFTAFGKLHRLRLQPDRGLFTRDASIVTGDGKEIPFDQDSVVEGEVLGEHHSKVIGAFDEGVFHGKILTKDGDYYVDPSDLYFDEKQTFPSVIYKSEDVDYEYKYPDITKHVPQHERERRSNVNEDIDHNKNRVRRLAQSELEKNACRLGLFADNFFTQLYGSKTKAIYQLSIQVRAVQIIYSKQFKETYQTYGLTFRVKTIVVYDDETAKELGSPNLGIDTLLDIFSSRNHDDYCESFLFTDRNFAGGILGLAWIGSTSASGGICSKYIVEKKRSYNTGIVTMKLYGRFTPPKISEITFAHELGHGFGSQHDPDNKECAPGGREGNYIMYDKATTGDEPNNDMFSECSKSSIKKNVDSKRSKYRNCFIKSDKKICGNKIVEEDEQCDCGNQETCKESCCRPSGSGSALQCKLKDGVTCSPSQGPCCTDKCQYAGPGTTCKNDTGCTELTTCSGASFSCQTPKHKENGTSCDEGRRVCYAGQCSTSVCVKYGLEACDCTNKEDLCHLCCQRGNNCKRAALWSEIPENLHGVKLIPGTPCDDLQGYCDSMEVCRHLNMDGPLLRLKKKFFTVKGVKELVAEYWWAILLGCIVLVVLLVLFIKLCSVYTPSSNPHREAKKPARPLPRHKKQPPQQQQPDQEMQRA